MGSQGRIIGSDQYVGEDILLREDYVRYYAATALSYVDLFVLERSALMSILSSDNFPHVKVRVGGTPFTHWTTGGALVGLARGIDTMTRDDGVGRSSLACGGVYGCLAAACEEGPAAVGVVSGSQDCCSFRGR